MSTEPFIFTARMFVAHCYINFRGEFINLNRTPRKALEWYKDAFEKESNGTMKIAEAELLTLHAKGGRHSGYAMGNYYHVTGEATKKSSVTLKTLRFLIFHNIRCDYHCAFPILPGSIKLEKKKEREPLHNSACGVKEK